MASSWERLASVTASSGDSITTPVFTAKKHLKIMLEIDASSDGKWRFGNATIDTGNNYAQADSANGGSRAGGVNRSNIECSYGSTPQFIKMEIGNIANREKLGIGEVVSAATGGGNTPNRKESNFKWVNTSNQINIVQSYGWNTISYAILTVWGSDDQGSTTVDHSKTSITNVPVGTRYEETDTRKIFTRTGGSAAGWAEKGTSAADRLRGLFGGAYSGDGKAVKYIVVPTTGTVTDFGNLTNARGLGYACASKTEGRALFAGGYGGSGGDGSGSDVNWQNIDYFTVATTGNASDFGDLNLIKRGGAGFGSQTRGIFAGGYDDISGALTDIYYVTYATLGNASDFGDFAQSEQADNKAGASNDTRGLTAGGSSTNQITYITIATTGNSVDFGDLISTVQGLAGCADSTRAIFAGGTVISGSSTSHIHMDYVTIASTGNATNFGNLPSGSHANALGALSDGTYGVWGGGYSKNKISYVTIQTTGNATDFGADLGNQSGGDGTPANWSCSGCAA